MQSYILLGAGGTGSIAIGPMLAYLESYHKNRNEEWEFLIIDGDNYEPKNLTRQLFDPTFVGINKATALAQMYARFPVFAIPKFVGVEDLVQLISENTIVFLAVDNYSVRALVEQRALELDNVSVINAGNEYSDGTSQLFVRRDGENKTPRLSYAPVCNLHNA